MNLGCPAGQQVHPSLLLRPRALTSSLGGFTQGLSPHWAMRCAEGKDWPLACSPPPAPSPASHPVRGTSVGGRRKQASRLGREFGERARRSVGPCQLWLVPEPGVPRPDWGCHQRRAIQGTRCSCWPLWQGHQRDQPGEVGRQSIANLKGRAVGELFRKHHSEPSRYPSSSAWKEGCADASLTTTEVQPCPVGSTVTPITSDGLGCSQRSWG